MTLGEYIESLSQFARDNENAATLGVVFHDADGVSCVGSTEICIDDTCSEEEPQVVRITMVEQDLEETE